MNILHHFLSVDESTEVSVARMAQMVASAFALEHGVVQDTSKGDGQFKKTASNEKLRRYLPGFNFTTLDDAVQMTVDWFIKNYDTIRK